MTLVDAQEYIRDRIADHCVAIEDMFKKDIPRYVTVVVRPVGKPEQEVIVTNDPDIKATIATIERRFALQGSVPQTALRDEWQPYGTHPKDGTWMLGWERDLGYFVWRDGPGLLTGEDPEPTHWMPLPSGPDPEESK